MTTRSVITDTFTLERFYPASPARVFRAFADPQAKAQWFGCDESWQLHESAMDFRVGGRELWRVGPPGGPVHRNDTVYHDIVPNERIIWSYAMHLDDVRISVSLACVELAPRDGGTHLRFTEQGTFLDGYAGDEDRVRGTRMLLDKLGEALSVEAPQDSAGARA